MSDESGDPRLFFGAGLCLALFFFVATGASCGTGNSENPDPTDGGLADVEIDGDVGVDVSTGDTANAIDYGDPGTPGEPWVDVTPSGRSPAPSDYPEMAYDAAREQVVLVTGGETWTWNGEVWEMVAAAPEPASRTRFAVAYDGAREEVVLYGGWRESDVTPFDDTWVWDGSSWTERTPTTRPPATAGHVMAYDPSREQIVLHGGGRIGGLPRNVDTWVWDGMDWAVFEPSTGAWPDSALEMVYDGSRETVLVHNGDGLWAFDGAGWELMDEPAQATDPPYDRSQPSMVYDPTSKRVLLFGGYANEVVFDDTWAWDGESWTEITDDVGRVPTDTFDESSPPFGQAAAFDTSRNEPMLFGGLGRTSAETMLLRDGRWQDRSPDASPVPRIGASIAYDRAREVVVLYGGQAAAGGPLRDSYTWTWDGSFWRRIDSSLPGERFDAAMAYDAVREEVILFGGALSGEGGDTYRWEGSEWSQVVTDDAPPENQLGLMVWDAAREVIVYHDSLATWTWDGARWSLADDESFVGLRPSALAYDPVREAPVMVVMGESFTPLTTAWAWDGGTWTQLDVGPAPSEGRFHSVPVGRFRAAAFWDARRQSIVMHGGVNRMDVMGDTWELLSDGWIELTPAVGPGDRERHAMAFDESRGRGVLFGGADGVTWEWIGTAAQPVD